MRRTRRGAHFGAEFGGSGEDSFVAVVVTKLTGALLFILLMSLVIMALIPRADELARRRGEPGPSAPALAITTPEALPEAIVGRPYAVALAAEGGQGPRRWAVEGPLPEGLAFDPDTAQIRGTPRRGTPEPVALTLHVSDGTDRDGRVTRLVVFQPDVPLTTPSSWLPKVPPVPWRSWLEQGFGFLVLMLVYLAGRGALGAAERWSASGLSADAPESSRRAVRRRYAAYRATIGLATVASAAALAAWLRKGPG